MDGSSLGMAKMNAEFKKFDRSIKLSDAKVKELKTSRDAIRESLKEWFRNNGKGTVKFCMQGSMAMKTVISPLDEDDYDIDDGIYLEGVDLLAEGCPAATTVHSWVMKAVSDQTSYDPTDKNTCVRVPYAHGYHVDIPIYALDGDSAYLAHKRDGWVNSDAKDFKDWLREKSLGDSQLRRIIRYLKRWKDYCSVDLKGIEITILACEHYESALGRDDDALRYTVANIIDALDVDFACRKPVAPWEDLFEGCSDTKRATIILRLSTLYKALVFANETDDAHIASKKLRAYFGDDFPLAKKENGSRASLASTAAPAILTRDGRSG